MEQRSWWRSVIDGQRAYLVEIDGEQHIKLDRANENIVRPFNQNEWIPDFEKRPLTEGQVAQVAFEADKKLCLALGLHDKARKEWLNLKDEHRIAWVREGPAEPEIRQQLYAAIKVVLTEYT